METHIRDKQLTENIQWAAKHLRSWADELDAVATNDHYSDMQAILQLISAAEHVPAAMGVRNIILDYLLRVKHDGLKVD